MVLNYSHHYIYELLKSLQYKKRQKKNSTKKYREKERKIAEKEIARKDWKKNIGRYLCCIKNINRKRKTEEKKQPLRKKLEKMLKKLVN